MASTAHSHDSEYMPEHYDADDIFERKCQTLARYIQESRHMIAFTGAGISTSAGVPDFRGPEGVWTLQRQRRKRTTRATSVQKAYPTLTHMSLVALQSEGILKYVVSQNIDGLHLRSGLPRDALSELHGNTNLERCKRCGRDYLRDYRTRARGISVVRHETGRNCGACGGILEDSIINFGENLPEEPLDRAVAHGAEADLCLVLGSSLTVSPACEIAGMAAERGQRLVICNLQRTPYHRQASLVIHEKVDKVMRRVMEILSLPIPVWKLKRKVEFRWLRMRTGARKLRIRGIDHSPERLPFTILKALRLQTLPDETLYGAHRRKSTSTSRGTEGWYAGEEVALAEHVRVKMRFFRHYREPDLVVEVRRDGRGVVEVEMEFDPVTNEWEVVSGLEVDVEEDLK